MQIWSHIIKAKERSPSGSTIIEAKEKSLGLSINGL